MSATSRLIAALLLMGSSTAQAGTYAVVIGNNALPPTQTDETLAPLRYADDDAVRFYQFFRRMGADVTILSVLDDTTQRRYPNVASVARVPSWENLQHIVATIAGRVADDRRRGEHTVFFLTFSGHGARSPDEGVCGCSTTRPHSGRQWRSGFRIR